MLRRGRGSGEPLTVFGDDYPTPDGTCIRDYIHVADLADAHLRALEATAPGDDRDVAEPLVCNLGSGGGFSVREVLAAAERVVGRPIPHTIGPRRAGDPPVLVASNERAAEVLGWQPAAPSLDEMIGSAWEWRQRNPGGYADLSRDQRGSSGAAAGASRSGGGDAVGISPEPAPAVAHRPHEPRADEHRDEQAQDRDLVRARPERPDRSRTTISPYSSWPMTCDALPTRP